MRRICVFCGANDGSRPIYREQAEALGALLVREKIGLVYGGSNVGLMGLVADTVLAGGGETIGVIPQALVDKEVAHRGLSDLRIVNSMHERKAMMMDLSDGFIALPGGYGTFDELCEVLSWAQLGLHQKPIGILNIEGYYDLFVKMLNHAAAERFLRPEHREMLLEATTPEQILAAMRAYVPRQVKKWITRDET